MINKKILFISRPFLNNVRGTGERVISKELYNSFSKTGFKIDFVKQTLIAPYNTLLSLIFYDYLYMPFLITKSLFKKYDAYFFNSPYQTSWLFLLKIFRKKTFVLILDLFYHDNKEKSYFDRYSFFLYKNVALFADYIITISPENKSKIKKILKRDSFVIPVGVDKEFTLINKTFIKKKKPGANIGYIGSYVARKRVGNIIYLLKNNFKYPITFHFAGNMPNSYKEEIKTTKNKKSTYKIYGEIKDKDKPGFYKEIEFLYFPTVLEGLGIPLVEAFRMGVIPIVHKDAEIPKIIKDHCVQINQPEEILNIVKNFNKDLEEYKNIVMKNYTYSKTFDYNNYSELIKSIIK